MKKFLGIIIVLLVSIGVLSANVDAININSETSSVEIPKSTMAPPVGWKPLSSNGYSTGNVESEEFYDYDTSPYLKYESLSYPNNIDVFLDLSKLLKKNVKMSDVKFKSLTPKLFTVKTKKVKNGKKSKKVMKFKEKRYGFGYLQVSIKDGEENIKFNIEVVHYPDIEDIKMRKLKGNYIQIKFDLGNGVNLNKLEGKNGVSILIRDKNKKDKIDKCETSDGKTYRDYLRVSEKTYTGNTVKVKVLPKKGMKLEMSVYSNGSSHFNMGQYVCSDITRKSIKKWKIGKWYSNLEYPFVY